MAKQIEELLVKLNIDGVDKLDNVKSSFRELARALDGPTTGALERARRSVLDFGNAADRSEQLIKGQLEALKGLRTQAGFNSEVYRSLGDDIKRLKTELVGASSQILDQRTKLLRNAEATKVTSGQVKRYIEQLKQLRTQTRANSEAFDLFESDIESLTQKVKTLQQTEISNLGKTTVANTRNAFSATKVGVTETIALFKRLGEQSKTAFGQVARASEGLAAIWATGKIAGVGAGAIGGISGLISGGGNLLAGLKTSLEQAKWGIGKPFAELIPQGTLDRLQELGSQLQQQQQQVAGLDRMMEGLSQTFTAFGPTGTTAMLGVSVAIAAVYDQLRKKADQTRVELEKSFQGVSDEVQVLLENLSRLGAALNRLSMSRIGELLGSARARFNMAPAGSPFSRAMASQIAGLESLERSEAAAQSVVLEEYRSRVRGTSQAAQDLSARLSFVRERLKVLDTTTAEGSQEFAQLSNESVQLTRRLDDLANSYRHVSDMAKTASREVQQPLTKYSPAGKEIVTPAGEEFLRNVETLTAPYREALNQAEEIYREHRKRLIEIQGQYNELDIQKADQAHKRQLQANQKQFETELAQFDAALRRRDSVLQKSILLQNKLGLGGRELSSFYQQIVGLGTGRERAAQQGMGKTPAQIAADIQLASRASVLTQPNLRKSGVDIGAAIGAGITEGATAQVASPSAAKGLAQQLINAYKRAFRIQSPSGESRDKVGVPIGQGIAEGIIKGLNSMKGQVLSGIRTFMTEARVAGIGISGILAPGQQARYQRINQFAPGIGGLARSINTGAGDDPGRSYQRILNSLSLLTSNPSLYRGRMGAMGLNAMTTDVLASAQRQFNLEQISPLARQTRLQYGVSPLDKVIDQAFFSQGKLDKVRTGLASFGESITRIETVSKPATTALFNLGKAPLFDRSATAGIFNLPKSSAIRLDPSLGFVPNLGVSGQLPISPTGRYRMGGFPIDGPMMPPGGGRNLPPAGRIGPSDMPGRDLSMFASKSIAELQELRSTWDEFRRTQLIPTDADFARLERTAVTSISKIDREIERRTRQRRRSLTGMQLAQGVGAAISGGIFGGPEGLIGGLGGLAVGGVGGAFAGAAAGAQVGMLRQQIGATADYAASIQKLQIALRGIAGSQDAYNRALSAAGAVTRELNVPQEDAIRGMTRLTAAIIGAGGTVGDSAFAFRAMSEAIKATGGGAEQVDGALLALTQVFSKGKVSAEELNQIAERLPGTFTLFAQAAGKTGPELQKALQKGQVGLADLMKFLLLIQDRYGKTALNIASSSQDAGARLTVAFNEMRLQVGAALQPLGAELQTTFAAFIKDITPALVGALKGIVAVAKALAGNDVLSGLAKFALQMGAVALSIKALKAAYTGLAAMNLAAVFTNATASAKITGDVLATTATKAGGLNVALRGLGLTLRSLAGLGVITITVDLLIRNFARLMAAKDALEKIRKERDPVGASGPQAVLTAERRYLGASREKLAEDQNKQREYAAKLRKEITELESQAAVAGALRPSGLAAQIASAELQLKKERLKAAEEVLALDLKNYKTKAELEAAFRQSIERRFRLQQDGDSKNSDKTARDAQAAADQQQRLAEALMQARLRIEDAIFKHQTDLDRRRFELNKELLDAEAQARIAALTGVQRDIASNVQQLVNTLGDLRTRELEQVRRVAEARQAALSAQRMEAVTQGGPASALQGIYRQGSIGPTSTGPHFDIKRADGGYFQRTALDPFVDVVVNGVRKKLSEGITVPGGRFNAPRPGRMHGGWDYAFAPGAVLTPKGGARLVPGRRGTPNGDEGVFVLPDGTAFKILHGRFEQGGRLPGGVAAQQRRVARETGDAAIATQALSAEERELTLLRENLPKLQSAEISRFIAAQTQQLRDQNQTLQDNNELQQLRNQLAAQLVPTDYIDLQVRIKETQLEQNRVVEQYNDLIKENPALEGTLRQVIEDTNTAYAERLRLLRENYDAQQQFNTSVSAGFQAGASQYMQSLGTMNEAVARLTVQGFQGLENAIYELTTTGTTNFAAFAAAIMRDTARMIIQQLVMKSLVRMIGNAFGFGGGFANGGVFGAASPEAYAVGTGASIDFAALGGVYGPRGSSSAASEDTKRFPGNMQYFAMGGVVTKPTLFRYANGGINSFGLMGEAGPEAIMPLRRLSSGRLGVESTGSGATVNNVTVNVDAKGSAVQGDSQKGEQLARAVSEAVQQELLKQKRPGGLLAQ